MFNMIKSKATDVNMGYSYDIITFLDVYRCDCFTTTLVETEQLCLVVINVWSGALM